MRPVATRTAGIAPALLVLVLLAVAGPAAAACRGRTWCARSLTPDRRAALLYAALTPAERLGLLAGDEVDPQGPLAASAVAHGVPRVGLPTIRYTDGPAGVVHGTATALPAPLALAATWDEALARRYGAVVGREARAAGSDAVQGPTVNIMRTPLGGRTFEGYGEDPFLVSRTAVGWVRGLQATGTIAIVKHLAANNQEGYSPDADLAYPGFLAPPPTEGERGHVDARISERELQEIELPAFRAAVTEGGAGGVMCAYNRVDGVRSCEDATLMRRMLGAWGFAGFTVADYLALHSTAASVRAGLDFEPWPGHTLSTARLRTALAAGRITWAQIGEAGRRILRTLFARGAFDRPASRASRAVPRERDAAEARAVEQAALTLLVNRRGALPLAPGVRSIAVLGPAADRYVAGGGSSLVHPARPESLARAIRNRAGPGVRVEVYDGADAARAAALAHGADVAVVAAADFTTEGGDRRCLTLECPHPYGDEDALIGAVARANPRTVVVAETGGPILTPWRGRVAALLAAWYPGQGGARAIASVLFGDRDPSGRLPVTFPARPGQWPTAGDPRMYPGVGNRVEYREGLLVGYRGYDAHGRTPAFPFGYGRSYTSFALGSLAVRPTGRARFALTLPVRNTGSRRGSTVIELYVTHPAADGEPPKQLRAWARVSLRPGATGLARLRVGPVGFAHYDTAARRFTVRAGVYRLRVGTSSRDLPREARVAVPALAQVFSTTNR